MSYICCCWKGFCYIKKAYSTSSYFVCGWSNELFIKHYGIKLVFLKFKWIRTSSHISVVCLILFLCAIYSYYIALVKVTNQSNSCWRTKMYVYSFATLHLYYRQVTERCWFVWNIMKLDFWWRDLEMIFWVSALFCSGLISKTG